jgi:membrane protein DedA with SNARE-associated domain
MHTETISSLMMFGLYGAVFLAPFLQEDAAVLGAAALAPSTPNPALIYAALFAGLIVSDAWKYGAGRLASRSAYVQRLQAKPIAARIGDLIDKRLGLALLTARFVPGTRIPLYVLSGLRRAPLPKFMIFLTLSAAAYIAIAAALVAVIGPKAAFGLAIAALVAIVGVGLFAALHRPAKAPTAS